MYSLCQDQPERGKIGLSGASSILSLKTYFTFLFLFVSDRAGSPGT